MKRSICVKILIFILSMLLIFWHNIYRRSILVTSNTETPEGMPEGDKHQTDGNNSNIPWKLKFILQWTNPNVVPFVYMEVGRKKFIDSKCQYTNCYVTSNRLLLKDYTEFDVIAFAGPEVLTFGYNLPTRRSDKQKYVFATIESSDYYPACTDKFDMYFNWTWTFRLDSELRWGYIVVRDTQNKVIGPNKIMHWMKLADMKPVSEEFKQSLTSKTKAAAWFVSNCNTNSEREIFVNMLQVELANYNLTVDIYGGCGSLSCPRDNETKCDEILKSTYYFYLAFENSFSEDYVTEKLLHGLRYNAIPIVYGAANYTRFMPDGIYLNAVDLGINNLTKKMYELIKNPDQYAEYFKWRNHYTYQRRNDNPDTNEYCGMCALLHDEEMMTKKSVMDNFHDWWDSPNFC